MDNWFKDNVVTILIKNILFDKKYRDVLLNPERIKDDVKESITTKAEAIGYSLKLHTHLPDIKNLKLKDGFILTIADEEFVTKDADIKIKLKITIKGKIENLGKLSDRLLHPDADIEAEMQAAVRSVLEDKIHTLLPSDIYLRFSQVEEEGGIAVDKQLHAVVAKVLIEKFTVDEASMSNTIQLNQGKDELILQSAVLRRDIKTFQLIVHPTNKGAYIESLTYELQYKILGVAESGWPIFLSRISKHVDDQHRELEAYLQALIAERLNSIDYSFLKSQDSKNKKLISEGVSSYVTNLVADKFGLVISIYTFIRLLSNTEEDSGRTAAIIFRAENEAIARAAIEKIKHIEKNVEILRDMESDAYTREDFEAADAMIEQTKKLQKANENVVPAIDNMRLQIDESRNDNPANTGLFDLPRHLQNTDSDD